MSAPVFVFAGFADTGKTTYICRLAAVLKEKGLRVAVVKDAREHALDPGKKDSDRFLSAGAEAVGLSFSDAAMLLFPGHATLSDLLEKLPETDIVLAEGFKQEPFPKIGLYRAASGKPLPADPATYIALVTDSRFDAEVPQFPLDDPTPLAEFLLRQ